MARMLQAKPGMSLRQVRDLAGVRPWHYFTEGRGPHVRVCVGYTLAASEPNGGTKTAQFFYLFEDRATKSGTIVPNMDTCDTGRAGLFGRTRAAVLGLLLLRPDERFHLRQVVRLTAAGAGAVQRELAALVRMGLVSREQSGRQVYFQAARGSPVFGELHSLLTKTTGVADVLREALRPLRDQIRVALLFGSVARGEQHAGSDIDLLVLADPAKLKFGRLAAALMPAQAKLGREVNPSYYPPAEFRRKLATGHHFLRSVVEAPKIFLIGDEDELRAVGEKRAPEKARPVPRRAGKALSGRSPRHQSRRQQENG